MKRITSILLLSFILLPLHAFAWDWTQIFNPGGQSSSGQSSTIGATIGNLIEGVLSRSDVEIADMAGQWTIDGSAVAFKSEDLLAKAGGAAVAAKLQTDIDPYFQKYGLRGAVVTIDKDGNCSIKCRRGTINGVITKQGKGEFLFNIKMLGMNLSSVPLYVRKTSQTMDLMFDVAKIKELMAIVAKLSGNSLAKSLDAILNQYEGIYVGLGMKIVQGSQTPQNPTNSTSGDSIQQEIQNEPGLGTLINILKQRKKK